MILYIDTTGDEAKIALYKGSKVVSKRFKNAFLAESFAVNIKDFLKSQKVDFQQISKIAVRNGTGFFSRVRTGIVAANALGFAIDCKVVSVEGDFDPKQIEKMKGAMQVVPIYSGKPNITKAKLRK